MIASFLSSTFSVTACALIIEGVAGYPERLVRLIGHPVIWIGRLISSLERALNRPEESAARRKVAGIVALAIIAGLPALSVWFLNWALQVLTPHPMALCVEAILASSLIAQRSLWVHVRAVEVALRTEGLEAGRRAVSMIVGRDPASLDEAAIIRAAIESLAENFSDGIVAPVFWSMLGGLPGITAYKAINTADSMIGHLTPRYAAFGWAAARCDDVINLPASRLSALWIILAAVTHQPASAKRALQTVLRDARHHRSPNAGWPEAAVAGALGLRLAGPRTYDGKRVEDHWMGDGRSTATIVDLANALTLYRRACILQAGTVILLAGLLLKLV
ncbi:cobalamin biosynthesis protein CobD [Gluconobacter sp. Dm-62]|uniref:adenosylcobinamide-phosphate synthase CbiB n=1 Tax=Gluconobacter sp. Dm-62 TaxID=2799804 RepID=UPI001B8CED7A|nr:adenosylcobinamide-phosphate synthase CbiB [Gluconobacter sp. Dm-62]MBS1103572.1 cobalamin biosynthesis protein CobD [Gluconobacter sp. Dm-62]